MILDRYDQSKHGDFGEWYQRSIDKLHDQQEKMNSEKEAPVFMKPKLHRHNKPRTKKDLNYKRQLRSCVEDIMYKLQFESTLMDARMNATRMAIQEQNEQFEEAREIVRKQEEKMLLLKRREEKQRAADMAAAELVRKQKEFSRFPKLAPISEVIPLEATDVPKLKPTIHNQRDVEHKPFSLFNVRRPIATVKTSASGPSCAEEAGKTGTLPGFKIPLLYPSALNPSPPKLLARRKEQVSILPDSPVKLAQNITSKQYRKVKPNGAKKIENPTDVKSQSEVAKDNTHPLLAKPQDARDRVKQRLTGGSQSDFGKGNYSNPLHAKPQDARDRVKHRLTNGCSTTTTTTTTTKEQPKPLQDLKPRPPAQPRPQTQSRRRNNVKLRPIPIKGEVVAHKPPLWR